MSAQSKSEKKRYEFNVRGRIFEGGTHVMGILNATPDSLFKESRAEDVDAALARAHILLSEGADILDVGGQSTRPGAGMLSASEEQKRVIPVIRALRETFPDALLSVDTFYASVAEEAAKAGADMINDVSCLADENMAAVVGKYGLAICVMHSRRGSKVADMLEDKKRGLQSATDKLLAAGVQRDKILLDGGIGFNLSREEDVELLDRYGELIGAFEYPFLLGTSRKSFLGGDVRDRLPATLETTRRAVEMGVLFVRVHDVKENVKTIAEVLEKHNGN